MKKIYIVLGISSIVLLFLIIIINLLGKSKNTDKSAVIPTPILNEISINDIQNISPIETVDFSLSYSSSLNKVIVQEKTVDAKQNYYDWAYQNNYPQLVENDSLTSFTDSSGEGTSEKKIGSEILIEFLNIFFNFGQGAFQDQSSTVQSPNSLPDQSSTPNSSSNSPSSGFTYYAQCNGYGDIPLPNGCNLCNAGCGPTTIAMIVASYVDKNVSPQTIVDLYKNQGYLLGCDGSYYWDAKTVLESYGLKTTDYMVYNLEKADTVINDFRNYINSGWTIFALANGPKYGHFFWITEIDSQGNIFAYDAVHGRTAIPYNENNLYPYPLYRRAFGVKK